MNEEYVLTITALDHEREEVVETEVFADERSAREAYEALDLSTVEDGDRPSRWHAKALDRDGVVLEHEEEYVLTISALTDESEEILKIETFANETSARAAYEALDLGAVADVDHPSRRHAKSLEHEGISLGYEETD